MSDVTDNIKRYKEIVSKCVARLQDNEDGDINTLSTIINNMCIYIERTESKVYVRLTDNEQIIIEMLADVWNLFSDLPQLHQSDRVEFMHAIHVLQNIVMSRLYMRTQNGES